MSIRDRIRRFNELATEGWSQDINLDLPLWRYLLVAAFLPAVLIALAYLSNGTLSATNWITVAAFFLIFMLPPILRRLYLRNQLRRSPQDSTDAQR